MVLLVTNGELLPKSDRWNFGIFSIPIYIVSVAYSALVTIVCFVSDAKLLQVSPMGRILMSPLRYPNLRQ